MLAATPAHPPGARRRGGKKAARARNVAKETPWGEDTVPRDPPRSSSSQNENALPRSSPWPKGAVGQIPSHGSGEEGNDVTFRVGFYKPWPRNQKGGGSASNLENGVPGNAPNGGPGNSPNGGPGNAPNGRPGSGERSSTSYLRSGTMDIGGGDLSSSPVGVGATGRGRGQPQSQAATAPPLGQGSRGNSAVNPPTGPWDRAENLEKSTSQVQASRGGGETTPPPNVWAMRAASRSPSSNGTGSPTQSPQPSVRLASQSPEPHNFRYPSQSPEPRSPQSSGMRSPMQNPIQNPVRPPYQSPQNNAVRYSSKNPEPNDIRSPSQSPRPTGIRPPMQNPIRPLSQSPESNNSRVSTQSPESNNSRVSTQSPESNNSRASTQSPQTRSQRPIRPPMENPIRPNSQSPKPRDDGSVCPPSNAWTGGKSPSPNKDRAVQGGTGQEPTAPAAGPRGKVRDGETNDGGAPPLSPRGKECSANSDCSSEDAELEALEHLPDRVLMFNKRDPVSVLMEYGQTREVKISFTDMSRSGPHHASRFHTAAIVDGETHVLAMGTSKKNAKKAAAIMALRTMYDRGMIRLGQANDQVNIEMKAMDAQEPMSHSTKIMQAARRMLEVAEETQFINYSKDKVLAAIVLERRGKYTVAGLGTGNRCIQYQNMAADGSRIIHSHAEVIARRAFKRFALRELCSYTGKEKHPLFTRSRNTGLIKLHDDIKVHLYISRPPCGDAAAFPTITNFPNRMRAIRKQGQLRTIIDDGEGAIPTDFPLPANANGKERLRVMTCSDKILRWNGVGIQGALLSNFMDPIYLNSLVIGSHTGDQRGHVPRAISGRLKCGRLHEVLMKPFRICSPEIVYPPCSDNYAITKSKQYCITWSEGDPDAEVIDAVTGAVAMEPTDSSPASRVSKRALLGLFRTACDNLNARNLVTLTYAEAKLSARAYQRTKRSVEDHLLSCGFGQWLKLQESYGTDNFEEHEKLG